MTKKTKNQTTNLFKNCFIFVFFMVILVVRLFSFSYLKNYSSVSSRQFENLTLEQVENLIDENINSWKIYKDDTISITPEQRTPGFQARW